jgi:hypothetical protein
VTVIILEGVVGSKAYGLDTPDSDTDRLGIFLQPAEHFLGLQKVEETIAFKDDDGDVTLHELKKWVQLALKCNPTVMELVWLESYTVESVTGRSLISMRELFLSKKFVRSSYLGYASGQFEKLKKRGDGSFSSTLRRQTEKHARHMWRLLDQGSKLYLDGHLTIEVSSREACVSFGERVASGDLLVAENLLALTEQLFEYPSPLADAPDTDFINDWLIDLRVSNLNSR